jgi:hypothetical protein
MKVKAKGIRVIIALEFDSINDPDSPEADEILQAITESTETMQTAFDASRCYVSNASQTLWADEPDNELLYPKV